MNGLDVMSDQHVMLDSKMVREAFGYFPSGVAAIAAELNGKSHVIVASSFSVGVSLDPPLVAVFIQKTSLTWDILSKAPRLGVSILSTEHAGICRQLASFNKAHRFENVATETTNEGALHIVGAPIWFECSIYNIHPAGDHYAVQLMIHNLSLNKETSPLIFHGSQFRQLACV